MPEELSRGGSASAVQFTVTRLLPAGLSNEMGQQLFARPALTFNQHRNVASRDLLCQFNNALHPLAAGHQRTDPLPPRELHLQLPQFHFQAVVIVHLVDECSSKLKGRQKSYAPSFIASTAESAAVSGHQYHGQFRSNGACFLSNCIPSIGCIEVE
jgi:hypothetical protein